MFVNFYARHRAEAVKRGEVPHVVIWLNGAAEPLRIAGEGWGYLGATSNYVFAYDGAADRSIILPINSIARIEPARGNVGTSPAVAPQP